MTEIIKHSCWILTDGKPGMENQCLGLAEAIGLNIQIKRIYPRAPWRWLPPTLWLAPLSSLGPDSDQIIPPWPKLLISSGRMSVRPAMKIKKLSRGFTFGVHIQNPGVPSKYFDLIIPPKHDGLTGENIISTTGSLHRVTPDLMSQAAKKFETETKSLPRPLVAVLVGGSNKTYHFGVKEAENLGNKLSHLAENGAGILLTSSRRTGKKNEKILKDSLKKHRSIVWDGLPPNPYFGFLGLADAIIITSDSVSMTSEAISTGKPVYVFDLPGGNNKFQLFHNQLRADGITRPFKGKIESWSYNKINDTPIVAAKIKELLKLNHQ